MQNKVKLALFYNLVVKLNFLRQRINKQIENLALLLWIFNRGNFIDVLL